jgi:hypothetical protein
MYNARSSIPPNSSLSRCRATASTASLEHISHNFNIRRRDIHLACSEPSICRKDGRVMTSILGETPSQTSLTASLMTPGNPLITSIVILTRYNRSVPSIHQHAHLDQDTRLTLRIPFQHSRSRGHKAVPHWLESLEHSYPISIDPYSTETSSQYSGTTTRLLRAITGKTSPTALANRSSRPYGSSRETTTTLSNRANSSVI